MSRCPRPIAAAALLALGIVTSCSSPAAPRRPCLAEQVTGSVSATWVLKADGTAWSWGDYAATSTPEQVPAKRVAWLPAGTATVFMRATLFACCPAEATFNAAATDVGSYASERASRLLRRLLVESPT